MAHRRPQPAVKANAGICVKKPQISASKSAGICIQKQMQVSASKKVQVSAFKKFSIKRSAGICIMIWSVSVINDVSPTFTVMRAALRLRGDRSLCMPTHTSMMPMPQGRSTCRQLSKCLNDRYSHESVCVSIHMSPHMSVHMFVYNSAHMSVHVPTHGYERGFDCRHWSQ